jgi:hypothetical protein
MHARIGEKGLDCILLDRNDCIGLNNYMFLEVVSTIHNMYHLLLQSEAILCFHVHAESHPNEVQLLCALFE